MNLRSRIVIITFLIILFVQGLNCFLEIGFLSNNLEKSNLRKYRIVGNQMVRKINTSLIFGKPLAQINHDRLLAGIVPEEVDNLHIIDLEGNILYSAKEDSKAPNLQVSDAFLNEKTPEAYRFFFPLSDRQGIKGNLVFLVSHHNINEKRFRLIQKAVFSFLVILSLSLPLLYGLLTVFFNRPYNLFIKKIEIWFNRGEYSKLKEHHIDLSPLTESEATLKQIRSAEWISPENTHIYNEIEDGNDKDVNAGENFNRLYKKLKTLMQVN